MFTLADKVLLDRVARLVLEQAQAIEDNWGKPAWVGEPARKMKLIFDRHQRDARDLRQMAKRLAVHFGAEPAPRKPRAAKVEAPEGPTQAPAEPSIEEQRALGVLGGHGADQQELGIAHG